MSVEVERATLPCNQCGAQVTELRRGRCWGCYTHWAAARPVGKGAVCCVCNEKRRDNLRLLELHERSLPFCHDCAAKTIRLADVPTSIEALRNELRRERRANERRVDGADRRIFPRERRVGERRAAARPTLRSGVTDPNMSLPDFEDLIIEIEEADLEFIEQTQVRETRH